MTPQRYKVVTRNGDIIYRAVTEHIPHDEMIRSIEEKFKYDKRPYRIYLNDILVLRVNYLNDKSRKRYHIEDRETGDIFDDCYQLADHLGISYQEAKRKAFTLFRYNVVKK